MSASTQTFYCGDKVNDLGEVTRSRRFGWKVCQYKAKTFDASSGTWVCGIHDPAAMKAKRDAKYAAWQVKADQEAAFREQAREQKRLRTEAAVARLHALRAALGLPPVEVEFKYPGHEPEVDGVRIDTATGGLQVNAAAADFLVEHLLVLRSTVVSLAEGR